MSSKLYPDKILHFPNNMSIEISYRNTRTFENCRSYDPKLIAQNRVWHQIRVMHNGNIRNSEDLLDAIFDAIDGEDLYPVAYRNGDLEDCFIVRNCQAALEKLFAKKLCVQLSNGTFINLIVELNVADFKIGQISPTTKIAQVLNELYDSMETVEGVRGILDLSQFKNQRAFFDIIVNLNNRSVLTYVCDAIYRNDDKFRTLNGINLSRNRLNSLTPLSAFKCSKFDLLDLRDNLITSATRLCRDLKDVKAEKLFLAGNPVTKTAEYPECLKAILKNFKFVDGIPVESLSKEYSPMSNEMDLESDGYRIDWTNKSDINRYDKSENWHAILIPDSDEEFTKEKILDYFFITISPDFSEFYPCYYKFFNNEHRFMVRQCFDQLKHLVENCNLEIKIPRIATPPSSPRSDGLPDPINEFARQVTIDKSISYYLRMDIGEFRVDQVEPMGAIQKALERRFSPMDRVLNLSNFDATEGLENIVVNLSSAKVLSRVLTLASRKFLSTCVELHLGGNKIMSIDFPKTLSMMSNLKTIDLQNNWIHNLDAIKELQAIGLKSLRLDGNPLCSQYTMANEYIRDVRQWFPDLIRLDNIELTTKGDLCSKKNFLCDIHGHEFVQYFLSTFFRLYESDRSLLKNFYHTRAIFTMTCSFNMANLTSSQYNRVAKYIDVSRNLHKMKKLTKLSSGVFVGISQIIKVFMDLPKVSHDNISFTTDTTVYSENYIVITVHGIFMEQESLATDILMAFNRTFVIMPVETNLRFLECATAYKIINDQYNIYNPTTLQTKYAFINFKSEPPKCRVTAEDREAMIVMLKCVVNVSAIWCSRCLEDANWDFEKALERFIELCERKEIPDTAFL